MIEYNYVLLGSSANSLSQVQQIVDHGTEAAMSMSLDAFQVNSPPPEAQNIGPLVWKSLLDKVGILARIAGEISQVSEASPDVRSTALPHPLGSSICNDGVDGSVRGISSQYLVFN